MRRSSRYSTLFLTSLSLDLLFAFYSDSSTESAASASGSSLLYCFSVLVLTYCLSLDIIIVSMMLYTSVGNKSLSWLSKLLNDSLVNSQITYFKRTNYKPRRGNNGAHWDSGNHKKGEMKNKAISIWFLIWISSISLTTNHSN